MSISPTLATAGVIGGLLGAALFAGAVEQIRWHLRRRRQTARLRARLDRFAS